MESFKNWLDSREIDIVGRRRITGGIALVMVLLSWAVFAAIGPNWGIDFTGGTEIHVAFEDPVEIGELRSALGTLGLSDDAVQEVGGAAANEFAVRIQDPEFGMQELVEEVRSKLVAGFGPDWIQTLNVSTEVGARMTVDYAGAEVRPQDVQAALTGVEGVSVQSGRDENQVVVTVPGLSQLIEREIAQAIGDREFQILSVDAVGPKVGGDLRRQGFISIAATLGLVLLYIAFRFDLAFAPGAIIALIHDISVTVGIFVLLQLEFNLPMIGALLTIVGYSLNDTIVIYDRIRENKDLYRRKALADLINGSVSETLTRTVATSVTTMLAILAFLVLGGPVIRNFAFAMFLGIILGTYSTMFVAAPMIMVMEDLKPWLSKFVAVKAEGQGGPSELMNGPDGDGDGDGSDTGPLTESEKRRRARAEAERRESLS